MAIYRGPGGAGDANADITINLVTELTQEAEGYKDAAASSATAAAGSASNASSSATTASNAATAAETAQTGAETAETNAETAQTAAETAQTAAETAQTAAETAVTDAETAQTAAETAQGYAEEWATKAEDSLISVAAGGDGSTDYSALHHAAKAADSATAASSSATDAETAQTAAETAQTAAETAQTGAETAQTAAETAQTAAETAQTAAETAQTGAETAQTAAETALASFNATYLGPLASDPTVDSNGDPVSTGDWYFNTASNVTKIYNGSTWDQVALTESDFVSVTGDTMTGDLILNTNGALTLPVGTEAQRPTPVKGMFRFNDDEDQFEGYDGSEWGAVGGGNTAVVGWENQITVAEDYTITSGNNMVSAGPITIDTGYTVTVPTGSRWVVV
jgi:chemotaxis protein histidine kinase CheA